MINIHKWLPNLIDAFTLYGGGKGDAPAAPDYTAAAQATAAGNLESAKVAAAANRVNQVTPYGNLTYTKNSDTADTFDQSGYDAAMARYNQQLANYGRGGSTVAGGKLTAPDRNSFYTKGGGYDTYTATQTLSPAEQSKLDKNNQLSSGLLDTANLGLTGVQDYLKKGFDFDALPKASVNAGQTYQDAVMSRLDPKFAQSEDALRTRLTNQGVRPGSAAWDAEFNNFNQGKNDAYNSAAVSGIQYGDQSRQAALQEQEFGRTEGLNMINALRTGNQVQQPNFLNNIPQQATTAGPDLLGAANAQYQGQVGAANAQNASSGNMIGGLLSAAGTVGSAYFL